MNDLISRQAAIDALKGLPTWWADQGGYYGGAQPPMVALLDPEDAVSAIENLLSVQPQPEIIRCKDCKYARLTNDGSCKYCDIWFPDEAEYMDGDYYCASAERKSNE